MTSEGKSGPDGRQGEASGSGTEPDSQHLHPTGQASRGRHALFEARIDREGAWRLDEAALQGPGWLDRLKQLLLLTVSLAIVAALWIFALALALVLAPLVAIAAWWMWRRLQAKLRARGSGTDPGRPW